MVTCHELVAKVSNNARLFCWCHPSIAHVLMLFSTCIYPSHETYGPGADAAPAAGPAAAVAAPHAIDADPSTDDNPSSISILVYYSYTIHIALFSRVPLLN